MNKSESIAALAQALGKAQSEIKPAQMNSINPFFKNRYADLGAVIEAARGPLAKYGLGYTQLVSGDGKTIAVETVLLHSSGEWISDLISLPIGEDKGRSLAQGAGSIITYLRRYSLAALLGVYSDEDADGQVSKPAAKPAEQAPAKPAANGSKPQVTPLDEAMAMTTPKGTRLDQLSIDQLAVIVDKSNNQALKVAAEVVLDHRLATVPAE